jgi:hypothetical protein
VRFIYPIVLDNVRVDGSFEVAERFELLLAVLIFLPTHDAELRPVCRVRAPPARQEPMQLRDFGLFRTLGFLHEVLPTGTGLYLHLSTLAFLNWRFASLFPHRGHRTGAAVLGIQQALQRRQVLWGIAVVRVISLVSSFPYGIMLEHN